MQTSPDPTSGDPLLAPARLFNRAQRLFGRITEGRLRALGLGIGQVPVLAALEHGGSLSQRDLARIAEIEQPSMAQVLSRMQRDGLVRREPDPVDARSSLISLTDAALSQLPAAREALRRGSREALKDFDAADVAQLSRLLQRVVGNLERVAAATRSERAPSGRPAARSRRR
jgi:MarR family transcriptional regulator for hemolysin